MASLIHKVAHGLSAGDTFQFANVQPDDSGIDENVIYYVLASNLTADDFEFSETDGGAAFTLTNAITDGSLIEIDQYVIVDDGNMTPPDPLPTPTEPTLTSSIVSGIVRLRIELVDTPEEKLREWEVSITHKFAGDTPVADWATPLIVTLPKEQVELSIPALGETVYAVRVRAQDVYGNFSDYSDESSITTEEGSDSLSAALAALANAVSDGVITETSIQPGSITTPLLAAGAVDASVLSSVLVLSSLIYAGDPDARHVEIDEFGIRLVDSDGTLIVNIPNDSSQPVYFRGEVVAESFSSQETNDLSGSIDVTGDAVVTLANGVSDPTNPPTVAASLDFLALTTTPTGSPKGLAYDSAAGSFWLAMDPSTGYVAAEYDDTTGALIRRIAATGDTDTFTTTLGSTSHISDSAKSTSDNAESQFATLLTMPRDGRVTKISVYLAGLTSDATVRNCLWNVGGTLLGNSPGYTATGHAFGLGNSDKYNKTLSTPISVISGQNLKVGAMLVTDADSWQWDRDDGAGKTTYIGSGENFDDLEGVVTDTTHKPNVYITYEYDVDTRLETLPMIGVATDGTYIFTLDTAGTIWQYDRTTGAFVASFATAAGDITGTKANAGLFYDATANRLIITTTTGTGAGVYPKFVSFRVSTGLVDATYSAAAGTTFNGTTDTFRGGARLADPLNASAATYWVATTSAVYAYTFSGSTATQTSDRHFGQSTTVGDGLAYDGTQFRGFDAATPTKIHIFTDWDWTTASAIYWFAYAWYDSAGTTHETAIGPRASLTLRRRERVLLQQPGIPTGGADDPDKVRIYFTPNATDPGAGNFELQATDALTSRYFTDYDSGGAADGAGTVFPSGSPASIASAATGWTLKGNGTFNRTGTAFPGSPSTGDHFYRSDLGCEFRYDGTRWLSTQLFPIASSQEVNSSTFFLAKAASTSRWMEANMALPFGTDWWIEFITQSVFIASGGSALSASHKWSLDFKKGTAVVPATAVGSIAFDSGSSNVHRNGKVTVGALLDVTNNPVISMDATKTGTPGDLNLFTAFIVFARIVAT